MAHLVGDIAKYFKFEEIDIDNHVFKLFNHVSVIIFLTGSLVGVASQYFGNPINCDFKGIDSKLASDYCWIHGTSYIPSRYQMHMKCITDLEGINSMDDAPDTSYYQWVTFFLLFQAGLFKLPGKLWKIMEGGMIESFGTEGKARILLSDETKYKDATTKAAVVEKYVKYFKSTLHHNNLYYFKFVFCEMINFGMLYFNFYLTNKFLQGRFKDYGWKATAFYQMTPEERKFLVNPLCNTFPTETSCDVPFVGAAGGDQTSNGLCVLSQNIINQKMFLVIWYWLVFLMLISVPFIMFRICTLFFDPFRFMLLASRAGLTNDPEVRKSIRSVLEVCYVGDWFVLNQLSKNITPYFFRAFVKELRLELRDRPKRSQSKGSEKGSDTTTSKLSNASTPAKSSSKLSLYPKQKYEPVNLQPNAPQAGLEAAAPLGNLLDDSPVMEKSVSSEEA